MKQLVWLIAHHFKNAFANKRKLVTYVVFPLASILFVLVLNSISSGETVPAAYGVIYQEDTPAGKQVMEWMKDSGKKITVYQTKREAEQSIVENKNTALILFKKGFEASLAKGEINDLEISSIQGDVVNTVLKRELTTHLNHLIPLIAASQQGADFNSLLADYQKNAYPVTAKKLSTTKQTGQLLSTAMLGVLTFFLLSSAGNMSDFMAKEKEEKTFYRLLSTPIKSSTYSLSTIIANFLLIEGQIFLTLFVMKFLVQIDPGVSYFVLFLMLSLFGLVAVSLTLVIFSYSTSYRVMNSMKMFIFTGSSMLAGMFVPIELMPRFMQKVAHLFPQFWLIDGIKKIQSSGLLRDSLLNIAILVGFSSLFFCLAIYRQANSEQEKNFV